MPLYMLVVDASRRRVLYDSGDRILDVGVEIDNLPDRRCWRIVARQSFTAGEHDETADGPEVVDTFLCEPCG
jgi:hypothetical protein